MLFFIVHSIFVFFFVKKFLSKIKNKFIFWIASLFSVVILWLPALIVNLMVMTGIRELTGSGTELDFNASLLRILSRLPLHVIVGLVVCGITKKSLNKKGETQS